MFCPFVDAFSASGNQCGLVKGMIGVKFRVLDTNGKVIFQTGNIPLQENLFTSKHAVTYERHGSDSTGFFSMNTCKGACKYYVYGNKCEQKVCCLCAFTRNVLNCAQKNSKNKRVCERCLLFSRVSRMCSLVTATSSDRPFVLVMANRRTNPFLVA